MAWKIAILTASDRCHRGEKEDQSTTRIRELLDETELGEVVEYRVVPDDLDLIAMAMIECCDMLQVDLILTTGGTGFAPRDVTPEATLKVVERLAPGLAEAMRYLALEKTPRAMLSRGVSGIRKHTLILNLPGSPKGAYESLAMIIDQLDHALSILKGNQDEHLEITNLEC